MTDAEFELCLQRCLDERRDPFLDEALAEHMALRPEAAVRTALILARLDAVAALAARPTQRRRRAPVGIAVAALLVLALCFALLQRGEPESPGRVLRATLQTEVATRPSCATVTVRQVLAHERGLSFETIDRRVVSR
ncbi:MAG: hypothetical protein ABL997_05590 [Planctomycetota bacterium]